MMALENKSTANQHKKHKIEKKFSWLQYCRW